MDYFFANVTQKQRFEGFRYWAMHGDEYQWPPLTITHTHTHRNLDSTDNVTREQDTASKLKRPSKSICESYKTNNRGGKKGEWLLMESNKLYANCDVKLSIRKCESRISKSRLKCIHFYSTLQPPPSPHRRRNTTVPRCRARTLFSPLNRKVDN